MKQTIFLFRHGETELNLQGRYQGELDSVLTPEGIEQVTNNAKLLKMQIENPEEWTFISSPLGRAVQSTEIVCDVLGYDRSKVIMDNRLREVSVGEWAGLTIKEIESTWPDLLENTNSFNWYFNSPNGERYDSVVERVSEWLQSIQSQEKVIVMSHGLTGRIIRGVYQNLGKDQALVLDVSQNTFYKLEDQQIERYCSVYDEFY